MTIFKIKTQSGDYGDLLARKSQEGADQGFEPIFFPEAAFDFQRAVIDKAVRRGRFAVFQDCGMGKTLQQLAWLENMRRQTNKPVLMLTPLAVAAQTVDEAAKFGIEATRSNSGKAASGITITNYEKLHHFVSSDFSAVCCDESSILKSFDGARKQAITDFMRKVPYRLLATATAAPNDYIELGTSSEALGYLGYTDMLSRFFKSDQNTVTNRRMYGEAPKWRFKGHAALPFWRWVCSWSVAMRKPSDLGFNDDRFQLPELIERQHIVDAVVVRQGMLFDLPAVSLHEQREERRISLKPRCEKLAELATHDRAALVWTHLNDEADLLEKIIPGAVQVSGSDSDESKESKFQGFQRGDIRVLITKPKIGAWGLNFQHCNHVLTFPSHSFEQYYQSVRRCWRFGQKRPVTVDIVSTNGESRVLENLQRKQFQANTMFSSLVAEMNNAISLNNQRHFSTDQEIPSWLSQINV